MSKLPLSEYPNHSNEEVFSIDILCVGVASYDLIYKLPHYPEPDSKNFATAFDRCGGGPAANAAVTVSRLGYSAAFAGYLGRDPFGEAHLQEFQQDGVETSLVVRGDDPTSLSAILVTPAGARTIINYAGGAGKVPAGAVDFTGITAQVILFDGHEHRLSMPLARVAAQQGVPIVLDAGNVRPGTNELLDLCDYAVCARRFATDFTGLDEPEEAAEQLLNHAPHVVITLGDAGLVWRSREFGRGRLPAFTVDAVDTTGAGDSFHGAFAVGVAAKWEWGKILEYASATAALCCTQIGARHGIPTAGEVNGFLDARRSP
jgi:sulfofructose kinase